MICFDTNVLIWGVQGACSPGQEDMIGRTARYIQHLEAQRERVIIPAIVVAEYLAGYDEQGQAAQLNILQSRFMIPAFDIAVAAVAGNILRKLSLQKKLTTTYGIPKQALRVDAFIVATAVVHKADILVTNDTNHMKVLAAGTSLQVAEVADIGIQSELFTSGPDASEPSSS